MKAMVRRATLADAAVLARVHVASWHEAYRGIVPDAYLQNFTVERRAERFRESLAKDAEETYVAELDGQVAGFLTLGDCRDDDMDHRLTGEIWGIYLAPEHWRTGLGARLARQAEELLASRGRSVVTLWVLEANAQARRFYEAMGYDVDGATKQVTLGAPLTAVRYRKSLKGAE